MRGLVEDGANHQGGQWSASVCWWQKSRTLEWVEANAWDIITSTRLVEGARRNAVKRHYGRR